MYIPGLIPQNFAELAEAVPVVFVCVLVCISATLPYGALGWFVLCDCDISWPGLIAFQIQVKHQCLKILIVKIN